MIGRMRVTSIWAAACLILATAGIGCVEVEGNRQDVIHAYEGGGGHVRTYAVTLDQAWKAARAALRWNRMYRIEEHPDDRRMMGDGTSEAIGFRAGKAEASASGSSRSTSKARASASW